MTRRTRPMARFRTRVRPSRPRSTRTRVRVSRPRLTRVRVRARVSVIEY